MKITPHQRGQKFDHTLRSVFADRGAESYIFSCALAEHRRLLDAGEEAGEALHNVLVFHGMGGIGKTALSARLEKWVKYQLPDGNDWGDPPQARVNATVRIDLRDAGGNFNVLDAVIQIRRALGKLKKKWEVFDLAFAAYWTATHPGEPAPGGNEDDNGFSESVGETVSDILSDLDIPGVGLTLRTVRAAAKEIERRQDRRTAFNAYAGYGEFFERCRREPTPDQACPELVAEMAELLAYEISVWADGPMPLIVVFVDTTERLALDPHRTGERRLNQLVHALPNVLFVLTGRDSLSWHEQNRTDLYAAGRMVWPGLAPGSRNIVRQYAVGKLSPEDARKVLELGRDQADLPMDDRVIDHLVISSGGLPQYLTLALIVARNIKDNRGTNVTVQDVDGSLRDLVVKVLEDVPKDEQRTLRVASMFPFFDARLLAVAAGVDVGCAMRACERPMVEKRNEEKYPYRMHDEIRAAIRSTDHNVAGGWAREDWFDAATRALKEARQRYEQAALDNDISESMYALGLAIRIVCNEEVEVGPSGVPTYKDWLSKAIIFGPSISGLQAYVPAVSKTVYGQRILDFISAKTAETPIGERRALLRTVFDTNHSLAEAAGRHLGYGLRNASLWDESLSVWRELTSRTPSDLHAYQHAFTLFAARRFPEARALATDLSEERRAILTASIAMMHGRPATWFPHHQRSLDRLVAQKRQREVLEQRAARMRWESFLFGSVSASEISILLNDAEKVGHDAAVRDCIVALSFIPPGLRGGISPDIEYLEWLDRKHNSGNLGYRTAMVMATGAFIVDNVNRLREIQNSVNQQERPRGRTWIPVECLLDSLGFAVRAQTTDWEESYDDVRGRWLELFEQHRERFLLGS